jgi:hypothetical protein
MPSRRRTSAIRTRLVSLGDIDPGDPDGVSHNGRNRGALRSAMLAIVAWYRSSSGRSPSAPDDPTRRYPRLRGSTRKCRSRQLQRGRQLGQGPEPLTRTDWSSLKRDEVAQLSVADGGPQCHRQRPERIRDQGSSSVRSSASRRHADLSLTTSLERACVRPSRSSTLSQLGIGIEVGTVAKAGGHYLDVTPWSARSPSAIRCRPPPGLPAPEPSDNRLSGGWPRAGRPDRGRIRSLRDVTRADGGRLGHSGGSSETGTG